jgi:hypothetical protein
MIRNTLTGTNPLHLHANGGPKVLSKENCATAARLLGEVELRLTPQRHKRSALHIGIFSNLKTRTLAARSLEILGADYEILGKDRHPWQNRAKTSLALAYMQATNHEWYLFSDATDVVFDAHPDAILERFHSIDADVLISGEKNSWPPFCPIQEPDRGLYRFGNSGGVIGRRKEMLELYSRAVDVPTTKNEDQNAIRQAAFALNHPIDVDAVLFQTLAYVQPDEVVIL